MTGNDVPLSTWPTAVLLLRIGLIRLSPCCQVEPTSHAGCQAAENPSIGGKRERNSSEIVHTHPGCHRYRRDLDDVDRTLTDDVASENVGGCSIDDQQRKKQKQILSSAEESRFTQDDKSAWVSSGRFIAGALQFL